MDAASSSFTWLYQQGGFQSAKGAEVWLEEKRPMNPSLMKSAISLSPFNQLVADCREGLKEIPQVRIQHCYREANKCADALARRGALLDQDVSIFMEPASDVAFLLSLDSAGTMYDRYVTSVSVFQRQFSFAMKYPFNPKKKKKIVKLQTERIVDCH